MAASADVGTLPAPAPGAQVNATLGLGRLSLTLALGAWAPASLAVPGGGRITIASALAGLRAGVRILGAGTWALGVQAGLDAGAVWGQGVGLEAARSSAGAYVDALAGASGRFAFTPRWALLLELEAGPTLLAPTFGVVGLGPVFSPAAAVGRARLGVEVSL